MTIEDETEIFFATLGRAIASWANVEDCLARIFRALVTGPTKSGDATLPNSASAAFYSVLNFNVKMAMTDWAFQMHGIKFSDTQRKEWKVLREKMGRKAKDRNELVHFHVVKVTPAREGSRIMLMPNLVDPARDLRTKGKEVSYNYKQIAERRMAFDALAKSLNLFGIEIGTFGYDIGPEHFSTSPQR